MPTLILKYLSGSYCDFRKKSSFRLLCCLWIISFFVPQILVSQHNNLDSILTVRSIYDINESKYWESTVDLANYYIYRDLEKAEETIESVFNQFLDKGGSFSECYHRHYLLRSWVNHGKNQLAKALQHLTKAEEIVGSCGNRKDEIEIQINKASLLIGMNDSTARSYVNGYMTKIDTSIDRNEKIAWIQGHYYLGELDEERGYFKTAFENYIKVYRSGVLEDIPNYRLGITKGIARTASQIGDINYAIETLTQLMNDNELFNYQQNNMRAAQATNFYKVGNLADAYSFTDQILSSENITAFDKIEARWIRAKIHLSKNEKKKVQNEVNKILNLKDQVEDIKLLAKIILLEAEVSSIYGNQDKTNQLLSNFLAQGYGSSEQNLKAERLWLKNNITGNNGQRLDSFLLSSTELSEKKYSSQLQEMMAIHKVEQEKQKNQFLDQKLQSAKKINCQRIITIFFLGLSSVLATLLWLISRRKTQIQKQLNQFLSMEKEKLAQKNSDLKEEKEDLIFQNQELQKINQSLKELNFNKIDLSTSKIEIKSKDKVHLVPLSTILYFKADMDGTRVYIEGGKSVWTDFPFKSYSQEFKRNGIVQIFRGLAININHIEWVNHATLKMDNGDELKIGRTYKQEILNIYNRDKIKNE